MIQQAIAALRASESEVRTYRAFEDYLEKVQDAIAGMKKVAERDLWTEKVRVKKSMEGGHFENVFEIQNLVLWGPANTEKLRRFCPDLPADFLEFYDSVTSAVLNYYDPVWIMPPTEIVELERRIRKSEQYPNGDLPKLVRFAECGEGHYFALCAGDPNRKKWSVMIPPNYCDTLEAEGEEGIPCRTDPSFSALLVRLLRTQCNPLDPQVGGHDYRTPAIPIGQRWRIAEVGFFDRDERYGYKRRYRSTGDYLHRVFAGIDRMAALAGEDRWTREVEVHASVDAGDEADEFSVRNFLLWGAADVTALLEWCPDLPEDFLSFYDQAQCALICHANLIWLMPPEDVMRTEKAIRKAEDRTDAGPPRIVRFAQRSGGNSYALRAVGMERGRQVWHVCCADYGLTTAELEGEEGEARKCDEEFRHWLGRMSNTGGNPANPIQKGLFAKDDWTDAQWLEGEPGY